jgi:TonB family protein
MTGLLTTLIFSLALTTNRARTVVEPGAQNATTPENSRTGVVLVKLSAPIYPPAARTAHISGDVDLMLIVRQDGSVESVAVVSGPPMLTAAAVDSAQHTQFECRKCSVAENPYRLVYTFQIKYSDSCMPTGNSSKHDDQEQPSPRITDAEHRVTTTAESVCTYDPASDFKKSRSLKCLYLWRCGS